MTEIEKIQELESKLTKSYSKLHDFFTKALLYKFAKKMFIIFSGKLLKSIAI